MKAVPLINYRVWARVGLLLLAFQTILSGCGLGVDLDTVKPAGDGSDSTTDTGSDADPGGDTATVTDTSPDTASEGDTLDGGTDTPSDTTSETEIPTDTSCVATGCSGDESVCAVDAGICVECLEDEHCDGGVSCDTSASECHTDCQVPSDNCAGGYYCDTDNCVPKKIDGATCSESRPYACTSGHCDNGFCCATGKCCADHGDCGGNGTQPICSLDNNCVDCAAVNAPVDGCSVGYPSTPHCQTGGPSCVECNGHLDCYVASGGEPDEHRSYLSPLGACTPDNTCTCFVSRQVDPKSNCSGCVEGGSDFVCMRDFDDGVNVKVHTACLRKCREKAAQEHVDGLRCEKLGVEYVWLPSENVTCYAFKEFGSDCSVPTPPSDANCSVDGAGDGTGDIKDGICKDFAGVLGYRCTYSCWSGGYQDDWCPRGSRCRNDDDLPPATRGMCHPL